MTDRELLAKMVNNDALHVFSSVEYMRVINLLLTALREYEGAYPHGRMGEMARNLLGHV